MEKRTVNRKTHDPYGVNVFASFINVNTLNRSRSKGQVYACTACCGCMLGSTCTVPLVSSAGWVFVAAHT